MHFYTGKIKNILVLDSIKSKINSSGSVVWDSLLPIAKKGNYFHLALRTNDTAAFRN